MTGQLPLITIAKPLTPRQQLAYDYVRSRTGVTAEEVGAHLHQQRGRHPATQTCPYCPSEGLSVLRSKAVAPLVIWRRLSGRYEPRNPGDAINASSDHPATQLQELPGESFEDLFGDAA